MNPSNPTPSPWSARRWGWTFFLLLAGQVLVIWLASDRGPVLRHHQSRASTRFRLVLDPAAQARLAESLVWRDPTLFALPNPHNFSGAAWLNLSALTHQPADWIDSGQWLTQAVANLGAGFGVRLRTQLPPPAPIVEMPAPSVLEPRPPALEVLTQSVVRVEGELGRRRLLHQPRLPAWPYFDAKLDDTVIQVAVNAAGETVLAQLWSPHGVPEADQFALRWAKTNRFAPLGPGPGHAAKELVDLSWGWLVFSWSVTNATNRLESVP